MWRDFGPWTDLYGVGCIAYTILTGHLHLMKGAMGTMLAKLEQEPPTPEANFEVPSELGRGSHGFFVAPRDDGFNGQRMRFVSQSICRYVSNHRERRCDANIERRAVCLRYTHWCRHRRYEPLNKLEQL